MSEAEQRQSRVDLKDINGTSVNKDDDKARVLNNYFSSVFTVDTDHQAPATNDRVFGTPLLTSQITTEAVRKKLLKLEPNKSPGPDKHHPFILKQLAHHVDTPLKLIFSKSLEEGKLPPKWKEAHVTPIYKKGDKHNPSNYRPVSLTSVVCKVMEMVVRDWLVDHMTKNSLFSGFQHGFIKGRSCATNLITVLDAWTEAMEDGISVDSIYLDLANAFDTVSHKKLLQKLWSYGIRGSIHRWIEDFLTERLQRVLINGNPSEWNRVTSGVPQGSVLGPILFVVFVNDLPEVTSSTAQMFADDTKLYRHVDTIEDQQHLQKDLDELVKWAETWKMKFNASKCKVLHIGRTNPQHEYTMREGSETTTLEVTALEKDLGIYVDPEMKFSQHIENQVNKANRILWLEGRLNTWTPTS